LFPQFKIFEKKNPDKEEAHWTQKDDQESIQKRCQMMCLSSKLEYKTLQSKTDSQGGRPYSTARLKIFERLCSIIFCLSDAIG